MRFSGPAGGQGADVTADVGRPRSVAFRAPARDVLLTWDCVHPGDRLAGPFRAPLGLSIVYPGDLEPKA